MYCLWQVAKTLTIISNNPVCYNSWLGRWTWLMNIQRFKMMSVAYFNVLWADWPTDWMTDHDKAQPRRWAPDRDFRMYTVYRLLSRPACIQKINITAQWLRYTSLDLARRGSAVCRHSCLCILWDAIGCKYFSMHHWSVGLSNANALCFLCSGKWNLIYYLEHFYVTRRY